MEVRIPTFRRPLLLKRALACLRNQTHEKWIALVFDDDAEKSEAHDVVHSLNDPRVRYVRNERRLGSALNLDRAFRARALAGASYAFVLEDDNGILPEFISENVRMLAARGHSILLRNQLIYDQDDQQCWQPTTRCTKGWYYGSQSELSFLEVQGSIFFNDCIANGGLFWDTRRVRSEFTVGEAVTDSGIQEFCRTVQIVEPILFGARPLGIWTRMTNSQSVRSFESNRRFGRAVQHLRIMCIAAHGKSLVDELWRTAARLSATKMLESALADIFFLPVSLRYMTALDLKPIVKGLARRMLVVNPISGYRGMHRQCAYRSSRIRLV